MDRHPHTISKLSAKYQLCAIRTADTRDGKLTTRGVYPESKHNFSLPPQKHSHMPTQNQTPSLHNTSSSHLRICQHHLGPTYSLQYQQT